MSFSNWLKQKSPIHGEGVFASRDFKKGELIELIFIRKSLDNDYTDYNLIRTEFGAFINHSEPGNCELKEKGVMIYGIASNDIETGEEITSDYNKGLAYKISQGFP